MSRDLRIQYPGAIYHVTSRGSGRADIVRNDEDRAEFWGRIRETVFRYAWQMFAAVLMTNHFHLFFRTPEPNLSRGMQYLLGGYANWWNKKHGQEGHVFQGRFGGHLIENETYFWAVSRYVHLNPVPAIVARPADWPWSTYPGYLDPQLRWDWVAYDALLNIWQGTFGGESAVDSYRMFVEGAGEDGHLDPFADAIDGWIVGSQEFAESIRQQLQPENRRPGFRRLTLAELMEAVCSYFDIPESQLARPRSRHPARPVLARLAKRYTDTTLRELAPLLGLSRADSVPHLVKQAAFAVPNSQLATALQQIELMLPRE